jgi:hypothetical protein
MRSSRSWRAPSDAPGESVLKARRAGHQVVTKKQYLGPLRVTALAGQAQSMYHSKAYAQAVPSASVLVCVASALGRLICNET